MVFAGLKIAHEQLARFSDVLIFWRIILNVQSACKRSVHTDSLHQVNYSQKLHGAFSVLRLGDLSALHSVSCE